MMDRARISAKSSEAKKSNTVSQTQKTALSQPTGSPYDHILFLQRTIGNQAVLRMLKNSAGNEGHGVQGQRLCAKRLAPCTVQAKLTIGQPNDVYEQEADRVADTVMRMPEPAIQTKPGLSGKSPSCGDEEVIQTKEIANQIPNLTPANNMIQRWSLNGHEKLTESLVEKNMAFFSGFNMDKKTLETLKGYSTEMDRRLVGICFNLPAVLIGSHENLAKHYKANASEAENHGEGGLYSHDVATAREINLAKQKQYEGKARKFWLSTQRKFGSFNECWNAKVAGRENAIEALGYALHIAQDRGSHGEGAIGQGHDKPGFKPDDSSINKDGFINAQRNTELVVLSASDMLYQLLDEKWTRVCSYTRPAEVHISPKILTTIEASDTTPDITPDIESHIHAMRGSGRPLPESVRNYFEPRFGYDFSQVRVHTDSRAAESARAVNALAYTVGRDIVFGKGEYTPNTLSGNRLLAHELAHVVQKGKGLNAHYQEDNIIVPFRGNKVSSNTLQCATVNVAGAVLINVTISAINEEFFKNEYKQDKENQKKQKLEEYLDYVNKFYEGTWAAKGWNARIQEILSVSKPEDKIIIKDKLEGLGKKIAAEWAKDNNVRKINTEDLKRWGGELEKAKEARDGGKKIDEVIKKLEGEVQQKLKQKEAAGGEKIQPKLITGRQDDVYEQEADRIAEQVMRMDSSAITRKCTGYKAEVKLNIRRKPKSSIPCSSVPDNFVSSMGAGQPLDKATRNYFEPRFEMDFSHVIAHSGPQASESSSLINALAYTLGNNVVFGAGQYQPQTGHGERLLAHEIMHVIQTANSSNSQVMLKEVPSKDSIDKRRERFEETESPKITSDDLWHKTLTDALIGAKFQPETAKKIRVLNENFKFLEIEKFFLEEVPPPSITPKKEKEWREKRVEKHLLDPAIYHAYREVTEEKRIKIISLIDSSRKIIDGFKVYELAIKENELNELKGYLYRRLNAYTPYYTQMANINILFEKQHEAWTRTCNITSLSMILEALGITAKDFSGNKGLLVRIGNFIEPSKFKTYSNLLTLRLPDFLQLVAIYTFMPLASFTDYQFQSELVNAKNLASKAIWSTLEIFKKVAVLFAIKNINFGSIQSYGSEKFEIEKKTGKGNLEEKKQEILMQEFWGLISERYCTEKYEELETYTKHLSKFTTSRYKNEVKNKISGWLDTGGQVIVNLPGHYVHLGNFDEEGIIFDDPYILGKKMNISWADANQKGYFRSYVLIKK